MKCKDCSYTDCPGRTSDGEKECEFQNRIIKVPDEWQGVRIQAAIAAMQGTITTLGSSDICASEIAQFAVACADAIVEQLKKK